MRRYLNMIVASAALLTIVSCEEVFEDEMPIQFIPKGEVTYDDSFLEIYIDGNGGEFEFPFTTNDEWALLSSRDWLTFEGDSDGAAGENSVKIIVAKSYEDNEREASLIFVVEKLREKVRVVQGKARLACPALSDYGVLSNAEQELKVEIDYNMSFEIEINGGEIKPDWITLSSGCSLNSDGKYVVEAPASGSAESLELIFGVEANQEYNPLSAVVTLRNAESNSEESFVVAQEVGIIPIEFDDTDTIYVGASDEELAVSYDAAINFSVQMLSDWVNVSDVAYNDNTFSFKLKTTGHSDKATGRTGSFRLYNTEHNVERYVEVVQAEYNDDLVISDLDTAGSMSVRISELDTSDLALSDYTRIYISGEADLSSDDLTAIESMLPNVKHIDISQTKTTVIYESQFIKNTTIQQVILPGTIHTIEQSAFNGSGLTSITVPKSVTTWGSLAFSNCLSLSSVVLEDGLAVLGYRTFYQSAVESVHIPASIESWIGQDSNPNLSQTFMNCTSLREVTTAEGLKSIGARTFYNSAVQSVTLSSSIEWLLSNSNWNQAFAECTYLTEVAFVGDEDSSVIGNIFSNCKAIQSVKMECITPPTLDSDGLGTSIGANVAGGTIIYVPESAMESYTTDSYWGIYEFEQY